uniref:calcitonin receptor-like n=1 Tax=Myxine glutinosa TaxID=7769 RepID=UPI00358DDF98
MYGTHLPSLEIRERTEREPHCERTWDGFLCWNDAQANTTVEQNCPGYFYDFDTSEIAFKVCDSTGKWFQHPTINSSWSNYTRCISFKKDEQDETENIYFLALVGHVLSIVSLSTSVFIFCYLRILSCQRVTLHKNLFCSYIFNSILIIFFLTTVTNHHEFVERHSVVFKILHILHQYMTSCNYFWMLCEGVYLHSLVVVDVFNNKRHLLWFYVLGWAFPAVPVLIYSITRKLYLDDRCWMIPTTLLYIVHGPICVALLLNVTFLLKIMHVLVRKMRDTHHHKIPMYMRAVRAALILVPLLGVQFVLIPLRPKSPLLGKIYDYTMHFAMDYQGLIVATIFCFSNREVQMAIKILWLRRKIKLIQNCCDHFAMQPMSITVALEKDETQAAHSGVTETRDKHV